MFVVAVAFVKQDEKIQQPIDNVKSRCGSCLLDDNQFALVQDSSIARLCWFVVLVVQPPPTHSNNVIKYDRTNNRLVGKFRHSPTQL